MIEFDSEAYLRANPDVQKAIKDGRMPNAWHHFTKHGIRENRDGVDIRVYHDVLRTNGLNPLSIDPPKPLMRRVHGRDDAISFNAVGRLVAANVFGEMIRCGLMDGGGTVLDFGCGPGRVIRQLYQLIQDTGFDPKRFRWIGRDIDKEGITWAARYLSTIGEFATNGHKPPLDIADGSIDFLYAISVFTHLDEDMQLLWLRELKRKVKIGGYLLLTSHGPHIMPKGPDLAPFPEKKGFAFVVGKGTPGLPSFYQAAFHSHAYINSVWGQLFSIEKIGPRGIANHQDLILCRRTS